MVLSKCAICGKKNSRFIKNKEAKGLLSSLGIKTSLSKVYQVINIGCIFVLNMYIKMNKIVKFLLAGEKFMPEMHLKQPGFTCTACGPFTKNKE